MGPNGAGKSTLLKCLMQIYRGGSGELLVQGRRIDQFGQKELATKISYVPQTVRERLPFSVHEFVCMGRYPYTSPFSPLDTKDLEIADCALDLTGMSSFRHRQMDSLSGGERQKALLAAALAQETEILLLDEPTAFLDPKHEDEIYHLLSKINRQDGKTILIVTHDINHAALMSDHILAMKNGSVTFFGESQAFMQPEVLEALFDKRFLLIPHPKTGTPVVISDVWK